MSRTAKSWIVEQVVAPVAVFIVLLVGWECAVELYDVNKIILPGPMLVASSLIKEWKTLGIAVLVTGLAAAVGLLASVVIGCVLAVLFSTSKVLRSAFYPYLIFLQTVPIVAIAPLLILWSGNNFRTVVLVTIIISIFPIVSNTTSGLLSVQPLLLDLFRLNSATPVQTLVKLRIPAAVGSLILGVRVSCGLAVIGAIIGDFFVGSSASYNGLGTIMTRWQAKNYTSGLIAAIFVSTILGILFFLAIQLLSRTLLRRWTVAANFEGRT